MSLIDTIRKALVPIHREGWPFIAAFGGATILLGLFSTTLFWIGLIATAWCAYFFRDPERITPVDDRLVVSPADGVISAVGPCRAAARAGAGQCRDDPRLGVHGRLFLPCEPRAGARPHHQDRAPRRQVPQRRARQGKQRERAQRAGDREPERHGRRRADRRAGGAPHRLLGRSRHQYRHRRAFRADPLRLARRRVHAEGSRLARRRRADGGRRRDHSRRVRCARPGRRWCGSPRCSCRSSHMAAVGRASARSRSAWCCPT